MTDINTIKELRKTGDLEKAYKECKDLSAKNPDDEEISVEMASCIKGLMDKDAQTGDFNKLAERIGEYASLGLEEIGHRDLNNQVIWPVRRLLLDMRDDEEETKYKIADTLFAAIKQIQFAYPHRYYSILLETFNGVKRRQDRWPGFVDFVDWWGLDNLMEEDYQRLLQNNGTRTLSLAERVYTGYAKSVTEDARQGLHLESADRFVKELNRLSVSHPEFAFTLYNNSLLLAALGRDEESVSAMREFVNRRQNEMWAWSMLGDSTADEELKLGAYCRALLCKGNPVNMVKVRQKAGVAMYERGDYSNARREFDEIIKIHNSKGWRLPTVVEELVRAPWYEETMPEYSNVRYYHDRAAVTEEFLLGEVAPIAVLITKYNPAKQIVNFVTEDHRRGFFSTKKFSNQFSDNQIYKVKFAGDIEPTVPAKVISLEKIDNGQPYENIFWRRLRAEINLRPGQTFTFVDGIYVDGSLLEDIEPGQEADITAVAYFNMKYDTWGWRAVSVTGL